MPIPESILYCIDSLPPIGGTEGQLVGLLERLDRSRFKPHVCTLRPEIPLRQLPADVPHLSLEVRKLASFQVLREGRRLRLYMRDHNIRLVQTFFQDSTVFGTWNARLAGVPVRLVSFRDLGFWREPHTQFLMRCTYPLVTRFVVNSVAVRDHFVSVDGLSQRRFEIIPNGLDTNVIQCELDSASPPRVILVGNLNRPVKRADLFVRAAALAADAFPDAQWMVVGDGDLRPGLKDLARELGVANRVEFLGGRDDVPALLAAATISVNCSDSEGFSNAVLESMLAGCAVVATDVGGNRELVRPDVDGLLVPVGDAEALAAAVCDLLADPSRRREFARSARESVESDFCWQTCLSRHENLYGNALDLRT